MLSLRTIPWKNIKTHKARTLILVILAFAQAVCVFFGMMVMQGVEQESSGTQGRLGADVLAYPTEAFTKIDKEKVMTQGTPVEVYRDRSILEKMNYCDGIETVSPQIYLKDTTGGGSKPIATDTTGGGSKPIAIDTTGGGSKSIATDTTGGGSKPIATDTTSGETETNEIDSVDGDGIWIIGYDPVTDFVIAPWVEDGKSLQLEKGAVAVGCQVPVSGNGTITLFQKEWPVGAQLIKTGSSMDTSVFVPADTLGDVIQASVEAGIDTYKNVDPSNDFSSVLIRVSDPEEAEGVLNWINIYVRKVTAVRSEETCTMTAAGIKGASNTTAVIAVIVWIVLLIALGITQSILMKERVKEIFVWHSIGASRSLINRVMLIESCMVYAAGAAAGVLAAGLFLGISGSTGILFAGSNIIRIILSAAIAVLITTAAGLLSSYFSLRKASKKMNGQMLLTV